MTGELQLATYDRIEVERLLAVLKQESRGRWPIMHMGCVIALCMFLGLFTVCSAGLAGPYSIVAMAIGFGVIWLISRLRTSRSQREALVRLAAFNDVRVVGPLLSALHWPDMDDRRVEISGALVRLLPRLQASDASLLTAGHRESMRRALIAADPSVALAVLRALEQIGDHSDIPIIQRLANRRAWTPRQKAMKDAAIACLPALQARVQQSGVSLLRVPDTADNALLRPAGESAHATPSTLLRTPLTPDDDTPGGTDG